MSSPFNEEKYKVLLEGLEITETLLSETLINKDFRVDSQFYTKAPVKNPHLKYSKIGDIIHSSQYGISIEMNEDKKGYPIYRMNELHDMLCDLDVNKFADITSEEYNRFALKNRDVLFNRTNSFEWVGRTGIYYQNDDIERTFASYLVRFNPIESIILPEYLCAFLSSKQGSNDIKRRARQSINQTNVNPEEVKEIEIPILDMEFQNQIKQHFETANTKRVQSLELYREAGSQLLSELGLKGWLPNNKPINIKRLKESFLASDRLDAEYYQPKYDELEEKIRNYHGGYFILGETIKYVFTGEYSEEYQEKRDDLVFYIRSLNMNGGRIEQDDFHYVNPSLFTKKVKTGNLITARVGTIGVFAEVDDSLDNAICSDNIICFSLPQEYNPSVYTLLLNSKPIFELVNRLSRGSVQQRLNQETLKNLILPKLPKPIQATISAKIQESFALKAESKRLLDEAKRLVEREIEKR